MSAPRLNIRAAKAPTEGGRYVGPLAALRHRDASGIYAIIEAGTGTVCYVGESHTGRLYDTITRHFRQWSTPGDRTGRREGGTQYDREAVKVAFTVCPADQAQAAQYAEIQRLQPVDNTMDGATILTNPPPQKPGPLRPGARVRVASLTYEVGGQLYKHDFRRNSRGTIKLPKSAVKNGWIDD